MLSSSVRLGLIVVILCAVFYPLPGLSAEEGPSPVEPAAVGSGPSGEVAAQTWDVWWERIKGKSARDALLLGMWSLHLDGTGEYLGDGRNNDQGRLIGLQVYGFTAGSFVNSFHDQTFFAGLAREVYSSELGHDLRFDLGYKFGLMVGYGDDLMNLFGVSPFAMATGGLSWKRIGVDLSVLPVGILTLNFRIDIDDLLP